MNIKIFDRNEEGVQAELTKELYEASACYYNSGISKMSDIEFDRKMEELKRIEEENGFAYDISPSVYVGANVVTSLEKSVHEQPALSLDKVKYKNREDLISWLDDKEGVLSWKMDGLTVVLTYNDGKLSKAVTRGNGTEGSVITHNARYFLGLPLQIPYEGHVVVRGECTMTNTEFERINAETGGIYENARNLASATIQMLDSNESRKRQIVFTAFKLVLPEVSEGDPFATESGRFEWMSKQGFTVVKYEKVNTSNVLDAIERWKEEIKNNASPTDGLVLSYEDAMYAEQLGSTGHHPRGSIAMKWTDDTVRSTVRNIEWSVGKTGAITPVAVFDTVRLGLGSNVSRASLHNLSIMKHVPMIEGDGTTECGIGSVVDVYMANMIIPQIAASSTGRIEIPDKCPVCGGNVEVRESNGIETLFCINPDCAAKHIKKIATFASKDGIGIDGLSESRIEYLISNGYIHSNADFYTLKQHSDKLEELASADGWGRKSVANMLDAIEKSKKTDLKHFLYSLSIPLLGHDLSKKLNTFFGGDIDKFIEFVKNPDEEKLAAENGIGTVKAKNLADWCREQASNEKLWNEFENLVWYLEFEKPVEVSAQTLNGLTFVITGSVHEYKNRNEFKSSVEARGGKVAGSVSSKTNFLVNNDVDSTSGKNKKAKELGVQIISEDEFIERFGK